MTSATARHPEPVRRDAHAHFADIRLHERRQRIHGAVGDADDHRDDGEQSEQGRHSSSFPRIRQAASSLPRYGPRIRPLQATSRSA